MKLPGIVTVLTVITGIPFTEWAWSEAPADRYGVVTVDGQSELKADADPVAEKMLTGYVDVFVKASDPDPRDAVETAMKIVGVWFRMESIQFEPESGLLHFEWRWVDSEQKATKDIVVIRFITHDDTVTQLIEKGETPEPPSVDLYDEDGLTYLFDRWTPSIAEANQNATYTADYKLAFNGIFRDYKNYAQTYRKQPVNDDQIDTAIRWFDAGKKVVYIWYVGLHDEEYSVQNVKKGYIAYGMGSYAYWDKVT